MGHGRGIEIIHFSIDKVIFFVYVMVKILVNMPIVYIKRGGKMDSNEIKTLRKTILDMTQQEFANGLGVSISTISKWECGVVKPSKMARKRLDSFTVEKRYSIMGKIKRKLIGGKP